MTCPTGKLLGNPLYNNWPSTATLPGFIMEFRNWQQRKWPYMVKQRDLQVGLDKKYGINVKYIMTQPLKE